MRWFESSNLYELTYANEFRAANFPTSVVIPRKMNSRFLDYPLLTVGYWTVPEEFVFRRTWALFARFA